MATNRTRITAAELATKLQSDPRFVAQEKDREQELNERAAQFNADEERLVLELRNAGYGVKSVWDLVNTVQKYESAIPILLRHLKLPHLDRTKEGIARALAVPEARKDWRILADEYRKSASTQEDAARLGAKDGLAVALSAIADDTTINELLELAKDRRNGASRILLLSAIRKSKSELAANTLDELAADPELSDEIASWRKTGRK